MLSVIFGIDATISVALVIIGLLVILRNSTLFLNRVFFTFTASLALWITSNFYSNDQNIKHSISLLFNHLVLFFPGITMTTLLVFVGSLTQSKFYKKYGKVLVGLSLAIFATTLTPLVVKGVARQENVIAIKFGPLASLYFLTLIATMVLSLIFLYAARHRSRGNERQKFTTIYWGLIVALGVNLITNALVPVLNGSFILTNFGPMAVLVIVVALWYSITKHQLFDIRSVVARSLAYLSSLVALGVLYGTVAFLLIGRLVYKSTALSFKQQVVFALLAALITFVFQPIKQFFDHITRRYFYKDAYNPQDLFNELNRVLVSEVELNKLLSGTLGVIESKLKTRYSMIVLMPGEEGRPRVVSTDGHSFNLADIHSAHTKRMLSRDHGSVLVTDYLDSDDASLKRVLTKNDIALMAHLGGHDGKPVLGHIVLGSKKSGSPYNKQDVKVMEAIADELVVAIQNALRFEQIEKFNETLQKTVEERTRSLQHANDKLRKLDQTKDDFISMASHQLRTPLTSVKGYVSMVLDGDVGPLTNQQKKLLTQSFISAQRMVYLIADLLNVSRLRTGKFVIEPIQCNLANVIDEEVSQLVETAKSRNLELSFKKPKHFPLTLVDETKIRQVVMNFIDNAIYYTPSGGHIVVKLEELPKSIEVTVSDDGIGVPKAAQHKLFTKFYRADNARLARPDGTGLGIYMAKKIIAAQGGAIIFKSHPGKGSTFGFTFSKATVIVPPKERQYL